jgi:hypothetical protein
MDEREKETAEQIPAQAHERTGIIHLWEPIYYACTRTNNRHKSNPYFESYCSVAFI